MEEVVAAKSVMQQSLFSGDEPAQAAAVEPIAQALQRAESQWRTGMAVTFGLAAIALAAALVSLGVAVAR